MSPTMNAAVTETGNVAGERTAALTQAAQKYRDNHQWVPLRLEGKSPDCMGKGWTKRTLATAVPKFENDDNIGILLGKPSGDLVRLDPDFSSIPSVTEILFPEPTLLSGRKSSPQSGRLYICNGLKSKDFQLPSKGMEDDPRLPLHDGEPSLKVFQILSTGKQHMAPPSIHPESGEEIVWENDTPLATLDAVDMLRRIGIEAFCMAVRQFWPARGTRNEAAMALARVLLEALATHHADDEERIAVVDALVLAVAMAGGDGEASRKGKERAAATLAKMKAGEETIGLTRLVELLELPKDVVKTFRKWLGVTAYSNAAQQGAEQLSTGELILSPGTPMHSAREIVARKFTKDALRTLHRHRAAFWSWTGNYYELLDQETIRSRIWEVLEKAKRREKTKDEDGFEGFRIVPFRPKGALVNEVADALRAVTQLDGHIEPPTWLNDDTLPPASEFFACGNGLLHLPTSEMYPAVPKYFCLNASEVMYDEDAPKPVQWLAFLDQLFDDDQQATELLQEWFGYSLAPDTSQQKILLIVGPRRSGKGTIGRILKKLLGSTSVAGPTMSSLAETFGLEPLIPKSLAIVSDARIGSKTNKAAIVERLLSISGEDQMTIARKFITAWHGQLQIRFVILTNDLPALPDGSGALAGRFIVLLLTETFFGREDRALSDKLLTELPGILNWAIEGYRRLRARGHFVVPGSAQEAIDDIETLGAPVKAFIRDRCVTDPRVWVTVDDLWEAWKSWSEKEGRDGAGTKQWFGRNLRSAESRVIAKKMLKPETKDEWVLVYQGIDIPPEPIPF